jgi:hypothetical protein
MEIDTLSDFETWLQEYREEVANLSRFREVACPQTLAHIDGTLLHVTAYREAMATVAVEE